MGKAMTADILRSRSFTQENGRGDPNAKPHNTCVT